MRDVDQLILCQLAGDIQVINEPFRDRLVRIETRQQMAVVVAGRAQSWPERPAENLIAEQFSERFRTGERVAGNVCDADVDADSGRAGGADVHDGRRGSLCSKQR